MRFFTFKSVPILLTATVSAETRAIQSCEDRSGTYVVTSENKPFSREKITQSGCSQIRFIQTLDPSMGSGITYDYTFQMDGIRREIYRNSQGIGHASYTVNGPKHTVIWYIDHLATQQTPAWQEIAILIYRWRDKGFSLDKVAVSSPDAQHSFIWAAEGKRSSQEKRE